MSFAYILRASYASHYLAFPQAQGGPLQHLNIVFAQNFGDSELKTLRPEFGVSLKESPLCSKVEGHTCAQAVVQALQLAILILSNKGISGTGHVDARVCSETLNSQKKERRKKVFNAFFFGSSALA